MNNNLMKTAAFSAALAVILSGCAALESFGLDFDNWDIFINILTKKDGVKLDFNDEDSGLIQEDENNIDHLTLTAELPQLDPQAHPFAVGEFFLVHKQDGTIAILDRDGNERQNESIESLIVMLPQKPGQTQFTLMAELTDGSSGAYSIDGDTLHYNPDALGFGGASMPGFYDPDTKELLKLDAEDNLQPLILEETESALGMSGGDLIMLVYPIMDDPSLAARANNSITERYAVSLKEGDVFGPVEYNEVVPWSFETDGLIIYNPTQVYETVFPARYGGRRTLISGGEPLGHYQIIKVTSGGGAYVQDERGSWLIEKDGLLTRLPDNAEYCSGLISSSILVLQDGSWNLYEVDK